MSSATPSPLSTFTSCATPSPITSRSVPAPKSHHVHLAPTVVTHATGNPSFLTQPVTPTLSAKSEHHRHIDFCLSLLSDSDHHYHSSEAAAYGAMQIHARAVKSGIVADPGVGNKIAILYSKVPLEQSVIHLFDEIPERTVPLFASLVGYYARLHRWEDVLSVFVMMVEEGLRPDKFLLPKILKACSEVGDVRIGAAVHGYILKERKSEADVFVGNSLIDMYANCGDLESAKGIFDTMPERDVVSWTALVAAYADAGFLDDALGIFESMRASGVVPDLISWNAIISGFARNGDVENAAALMNQMKDRGSKPGVNTWNGVISGCVQSGLFEDALEVFLEMVQVETPNATTIASILPSCSSLNELSIGEGLHAYATKCDLLSNVYVIGSLINMYLKCGESEDAERVFATLESKTATVWNEMIAAYANEGRMDEALEYLQLMIKDRLKPDVITYNTVLAAYARSGQKDEAFRRFSEMHQMGLEPNVVSLNAIIAGFQQSGLDLEALELFRIMHLSEEILLKKSHLVHGFPPLNNVIQPNAITISSAVAACASLRFKSRGKEIHAYVLRNYLDSNVFVSSALVDMYAKCDDLTSALRGFNEIDEKNTVSWNVLIAGYNSNGQPEEALKLLMEMLEQGFILNSITLMILLSACSNTSALNLGRGLHSYILKNKWEDTPVTLQSALIDMYSKCGSVTEARLVFDYALDVDLELWNAMISCYSLHGMAKEAIYLFEKIVKSGLQPDHITFNCILSVCSQNELNEKGWKYFNSMEKFYGVTPTLEHFTCMVRIMGDAGLLQDALGLIQRMPFDADACLWATLLRACRVHSNYEIGEIAAKKLFELEPTNTSNYIVLYNIYAMTGMWDAAMQIRIAMRARGLRTVRACSWINIGHVIHAFKAGESVHPDMDKILDAWDQISNDIKLSGYVPQDIIFHDDEEVDPFSCFHTEKLAISFGIISLRAQTPVRISKNIRMCIDCHTTAKFISKIHKREVLVRDGSFYHHFKDGICSCKDKW